MKGRELAIPGALNIAITLGAAASAAALLFLVQHSPSLWVRAAAVIAFSFVGNTLFSMLHESVHRVAHADRAWNEAIGEICAAFFPTSLAFQRICHLGHHRRNRTDVEMFDLYYARDSWWLKAIQLYGILLGFYWPLAPLGLALYILCPAVLRSRLLRDTSSIEIKHTGADAMLADLTDARAPRGRIVLEGLLALVLQLALVTGLGLSWKTWLVCYFAFGFNWASLQYADHVGSRRDIREGAWNLRVNPLVEKLFLNYHYHLVHHRNPGTSWVHLPALRDPGDPWPSFWRKYLELWKGPQLTREPPPRDIDPDFERMIG